MLKHFHISLITFSILSSCGDYSIATPSGRPEVVVSPPIGRAKSIAIQAMTESGYTLTDQTSNMLTFERSMEPGEAAIYLMAVGNAYHATPAVTLRLSFVQLGGEVKIYGAVRASTQGPFGQARNTDLTRGKSGQQLQQGLERIKNRIAGDRR